MKTAVEVKVLTVDGRAVAPAEAQAEDVNVDPTQPAAVTG
jgi:hypothetical protein